MARNPKIGAIDPSALRRSAHYVGMSTDHKEYFIPNQSVPSPYLHLSRTIRKRMTVVLYSCSSRRHAWQARRVSLIVPSIRESARKTTVSSRLGFISISRQPVFSRSVENRLRHLCGHKRKENRAFEPLIIET
jgi:hypothetical protein